MSSTGRMAFEPLNESKLNGLSRINSWLTKKAAMPQTPRSFREILSRSTSCILDNKSNSPPFSSNSSNTRGGGDTASLAATKLKLKLQLALYKVQQKETQGSLRLVRSTITPPKVSLPFLSQTDQRRQSHPPTLTSCDGSQLPTPPEIKYASSANLNLKTNVNSEEIKPTLSKIALRKQANRNKNRVTKLKLFQIKKSSIFFDAHKANRKENALTSSSQPTALPMKRTSSAPPISVNSSFDDKKPSPLAIDQVRLPRPEVNKPVTLRNTSLPSINKILKTPMKNSNSTRSLINLGNEDTIDEDNLTIIDTSNTTTIKKSNDDTLDNHEDTNTSKTMNNSTILTSSPTSNAFGTPNSFSVAKSLLQLGGYNF